ncbi:ATP-binding cassette domain-containing protein [Williamsia sterculiae]|uniref:Iron complex transport system ATP-binding protein n=1 Tax=Williamsia sterculiae TaxID=1344003 RepID=A0A1N7FT83_9NOCA|nr:ATP-binding cassette domain-containing protein [Williamsia sterculiae]SIS03531.1 iron complex transport system ATP-binding protein [Williamsia sterculiae]
MTSSHLSASDLVLRYDDRVVIDGLSVRIPPGRITALVGPNACGKSTLLRGLGRILAPAGGVVRLDDTDVRDVPRRQFARRVGLLPQSPIAPDGITVVDLVERGRSPHQGWFGGRDAADDDAVLSAMRSTGVLSLADRPVAELSGGQRQRVWIAMALAQDTDVLLLDEPTTYLDVAHAVEVLDLLVDRNVERQTTVVVVLHDLNLACRYADHLIAMNEGRVITAGAPDEVMTEDLVSEVFGMRARVIPDPVSQSPMVVPAGRHHPLPQRRTPDGSPTDPSRIRDERALRDVVPEPHPAIMDKGTDRIDPVAARFLAAAPIVFMATTGNSGAVTVSPRGDHQGSGVRILDDGRRLALPQRRGNRRVDSMRNLLHHSGVGLLFCVPRVTHVLRVNGHATVVTDPEILGLWDGGVDVAIVVDIEETFVHCGKALHASKLWDPESWGDPDDLPTSKELYDAAVADRDD